MAINNGRYVVTGGYMEPDGTIVEERQYVPGTNVSVPGTTNLPPAPTVANSAFPRAEAYGLQSQGYANQGNNAMATAYGNIADSLGRYSKFANTSLQNYDALLNTLRQNEAGLQGAAGNLYNTLTQGIQNDYNYVNRMFGPNGELTQEVNKYYDDLGNYLATDAGRQAANIAAQGVHSGASLGAIRAQQNEAYNQSFQRYIQAKEQQINAKQQLASNLINYMSALRQEYGNTTNQYVIDLYKRANDLYNSVAQSAAADINTYNQARLTYSSGSSTPQNTYDIYGNLIDSSGNIVKTADEIEQEIALNNLSKVAEERKNNKGVYGPYTWQWYTLPNNNNSSNTTSSNRNYTIG